MALLLKQTLRVCFPINSNRQYPVGWAGTLLSHICAKNYHTVQMNTNYYMGGQGIRAKQCS